MAKFPLIMPWHTRGFVGQEEHIHCWHEVKAGHRLVDRCCRCGRERSPFKTFRS